MAGGATYMRFLWRLLLAPINGLLITLVTIPMIALAGAGIWAFVTIGSASGPAIIAVVVIFLLVMMNVIMTQMARCAGSFSGALRFSEQIPFRKAFWRVLIITILLGIAGFILVIALAFAFAQQGSGAIAFLNSIGIQGDDDASEKALISYLESRWFLSYTLLYMFLCAIQAVFLVPFACGMGERFALAWTGTWFLLRLVVIVPFMSVAVYAIGSVLGDVLVGFAPEDEGFRPLAAEIRWAIISLLSMQFGLAGEAAVLRTVKEPASQNRNRAGAVRNRGMAEVPEQEGPSAGDLLRDRMSR